MTLQVKKYSLAKRRFSLYIQRGFQEQEFVIVICSIFNSVMFKYNYFLYDEKTKNYCL